MRLTGILIFILFLLIQNVFGQKLLKTQLGFSVENVSINEALLKLSEESGIDIAYSSSFLKNTPRISLEMESSSLEEILAQLLAKTHLSYRVLGDRIILFKKKKKRYTISGYLEDKESGERLISARIYCPKIKRGCISNEYGFFSLNLEEGKYEIEYHYIGYQPKKKTIHLKKNIHQSLALQPNMNLPAVVILPENANSQIATEDTDKSIQINTAFVKASPGLGGEEDHLRAAQMLPGIQGGIDGLGGMNIRGGESGQNLMLLDGVPVYIPFHLLGAYSIYNSSMVRSAKLMKGNFSSRYGGRLSSVFDVRTREGNLHKWKAEASFNLVNAKALIEGPIKKGKGSFLISGRFAPTDFLLNPVLERIYFQKNEGNLTTRFSDLNIKVNYAVSKKDRLYLSLFSGSDLFTKYSGFFTDDFSSSSQLDFSWQNSVTALRWNHLFNSKLFANLTITNSNYGYEYSSLDQYYDSVGVSPEDFYFLDSRSENTDIGIQIDFDYLPNTRHAFRFGVGIAARTFIPDLTYFDVGYEEFEGLDTFNIDILSSYIESSTFFATEANFYVEDNIHFNDRWQARMGLRGSAFFTLRKDYHKLEPRFQINYKANEQLRIHGSVNRMVQYLHLISNSSIRLPNDIWIPSTENILPEEAWQGEIGARYDFHNGFRFASDIYLKKMNNLYAYPDGFSYLEDVNNGRPEDYIERGKGHSYGLELMLNYEEKDRGGMFSYVLARSVRQYEGQNLGKRYPHEYDSRHQVKLFLFQRLNKRFQVGLNWVYFSPNPRLNLRAIDTGQGLKSIDVNPRGKKNFSRTTSYHRLDLNASYKILSRKAEQVFKIGLSNAYDRRNIAYYELIITPGGATQGRPIYSIPRLPSFSYSLKF